MTKTEAPFENRFTYRLKGVSCFFAVKNGNQTGIVDSILFLKQKDEKYFVLMLPLKDNYDANGNITHVFELDNQVIRYYYDGLNRLVREDNNYIDK